MTRLDPASSRPSALLIPALSAANFAVGMGAFVVIGILSPIVDAFALTAAEAGWVMTAYAIAYAIGSPLLVASTGSAARRTLLAAGLGIFALASILSALADSAAMLITARVLAAAGAGLVTPVAAGVAAASSSPERRGKALAAAFFGVTLAQVLGVPAGAWLGYTFGWSTAFWLSAALSLIALGGILALVPRNTPVQAASPGALIAALRDPATTLSLLFTVLIMAAIYVFYTYAAPVLEARMGMGREGVSLFLLAFGLGAVAGNLFGGMLTDRIGAFRTLVFVGAAQVILLPFYAHLPLPEWVVIGHAMLWSLCGWSFAAAQQTRLVSLGPERANIMLALNASGIYVGVSVGSWIGGTAIALAGLDALGWTAAGVAALALVALFASERVR